MSRSLFKPCLDLIYETMDAKRSGVADNFDSRTSTTNGLPFPSMRTSISSLPQGCMRQDVAPSLAITASPRISSTLPRPLRTFCFDSVPVESLATASESSSGSSTSLDVSSSDPTVHGAWEISRAYLRYLPSRYTGCIVILLLHVSIVPFSKARSSSLVLSSGHSVKLFRKISYGGLKYEEIRVSRALRVTEESAISLIANSRLSPSFRVTIYLSSSARSTPPIRRFLLLLV
mmetsp:Transcript_12789/g.19261  ORF Transcript_12789/g.19261 Transcript_12789/m.19261 type:complete len:232 (-) Transcript_12789:191-886(-)